MISSYAESGLCDEAFALFSQLEKLDNYPLMKPDVISWSAVINGFASNGRCEDSLELFRQMQLAKGCGNVVVAAEIVAAVAEIVVVAGIVAAGGIDGPDWRV
ncbi:hypothetical protein RJ639_003133 [Escallonia herrerae]|uniref:Pentatricopeptide repeat-containing protein n=1 Tax=Escallonia herrerae TaxID=1293975 RepID=A0AA88W132_9ASTE|nr:hypothetical protein RJ639_003133 [Escallonia herrerae]